MIRTLKKAAYEAGKILKDNFGGSFEISSKIVASNLVTEIDKLSEKKIIEVIREDFPGHYILSEEAGELIQDSEFKWLIDPIDGTVNYAHSIPITCVSIALEKKGKIICGAVYNPISQEFFFSEKGKGSYLNDKKIFVSNEKELDKSLLVTGFPYDSSTYKPDPSAVFKKFLMRDIPIRRLGSAAIDLCWTACGRFEGFWEYNLNAWDVAAGYLILTEAGGKVTDFTGKEFSVYGKQILATNGNVHEQMMEVINNQVN
ncbi:MAG TPA: inositol monophosphatase family protein [Ignavibacteria bacterium]|nr:inositol monophosphatase [Bacteroidota bacterium]HRI85732.1 inositol monophosphatase family protein [Ignavibacteria bacterium]HRJ99301.1 inositol monophosphatase family protein [Ignavibacteria bacterium]